MVRFLLQMSNLHSLQKVKYAHPYFQKSPGNLTFSLFLTDGSITGSMFARRLSFFGGKSIRDYFMGKSGAFCGSFCVCWQISNYKNYYQFINQIFKNTEDSKSITDIIQMHNEISHLEIF